MQQLGYRECPYLRLTQQLDQEPGFSSLRGALLVLERQ